MEFVEIMKIKQRMCSSLDVCRECPISIYNNGHDAFCGTFMVDMPEESEKILLEWAEAHPVLTNRKKFE